MTMDNTVNGRRCDSSHDVVFWILILGIAFRNRIHFSHLQAAISKYWNTQTKALKLIMRFITRCHCEWKLLLYERMIWILNNERQWLIVYNIYIIHYVLWRLRLFSLCFTMLFTMSRIFIWFQKTELFSDDINTFNDRVVSRIIGANWCIVSIFACSAIENDSKHTNQQFQRKWQYWWCVERSGEF